MKDNLDTGSCDKQTVELDIIRNKETMIGHSEYG